MSIYYENSIEQYITALGLLQGNIQYADIRDKIHRSVDRDWAITELRRLFDRSEFCIPLESSYYPELLRHIEDPPPACIVRGAALEPLQKLTVAVAVVGSRSASTESCLFAEKIGWYLAEHGVTVVSGLAKGIDAAAHRGALRSGRSGIPTIAVVGHGLDYMYPASHRELAAQIVKSGGYIVSQFLNSQPPFPAHFLNRNRVIAGIATATIVISAPQASGSLVTARYALEHNRALLVVPGPVWDPRYAGSNILLKQGAHICSSIDDIFENLPGVQRVATQLAHKKL